MAVEAVERDARRRARVGLGLIAGVELLVMDLRWKEVGWRQSGVHDQAP